MCTKAQLKERLQIKPCLNFFTDNSQAQKKKCAQNIKCEHSICLVL